jgi:hypothetical protein
MKHTQFTTTERPEKEGVFSEAFATLSGMGLQANCLSVRMVLKKSRGWYSVRVDVYDDSPSEEVLDNVAAQLIDDLKACRP